MIPGVVGMDIPGSIHNVLHHFIQRRHGPPGHDFVRYSTADRTSDMVDDYGAVLDGEEQPRPGRQGDPDSAWIRFVHECRFRQIPGAFPEESFGGVGNVGIVLDFYDELSIVAQSISHHVELPR